jgi:hypothetical protein
MSGDLGRGWPTPNSWEKGEGEEKEIFKKIKKLPV